MKMKDKKELEVCGKGKTWRVVCSGNAIKIDIRSELPQFLGGVC